jgi:hypothetical protein
MNLLENHALRCRACEPLLQARQPFFCLRGRQLENRILDDLYMRRDGRVYSTDTKGGCRIRIEVASHFCTVFTVLQQVDLR